VIAPCPLGKDEPRRERARGGKKGINLPIAERERARLYRYIAVTVVPLLVYSVRDFCIDIKREREGEYSCIDIQLWQRLLYRYTAMIMKTPRQQVK